MQNHLLVVPRPWEPGTYAIVEFQAPAELSALECVNRIKATISAWLRETKQGQEALQSVQPDAFNVGDLEGLCCSTSLLERLADRDIYEFSVECTNTDSQVKWAFDDNLVTEPVLNQKFYFASIVEVFSGYETESKFIFRSTEEGLDDKLNEIQENFRGVDLKEGDDVWCDGILIKCPNYREVPKEHFNVLKTYLSEL